MMLMNLTTLPRILAPTPLVCLLCATSLWGQTALDPGPWPTLGHDNQRTNQSTLQGPIVPSTPTLIYDAGTPISINQIVATSDGKILLTACIGEIIGLNQSGQPFSPAWPFPLLPTAYPGSPETPVGITVSNSGTIYVPAMNVRTFQVPCPPTFIRSNRTAPTLPIGRWAQMPCTGLRRSGAMARSIKWMSSIRSTPIPRLGSRFGLLDCRALVKAISRWTAQATFT